MARKDLLKGLMDPGKPAPSTEAGAEPRPTRVDAARPRYSKGAIGAVSQSIAELKSRSIVEVDPRMIDDAGFRDRLDAEDPGLEQLIESIRVYGQQVPVLLRPNPDDTERYQVVYGRRRVAALKALHATPALANRFDPFAQIDALIAEYRRLGALLPDDIDWLRRLIGAAEPVLRAGATLAPCRNDGSASNLMMGPDGAVLLVDYDRAGMNDPLYDLGALLAETTDFERDMQAGFAAYAGGFDETGFARARLWSFVDDMLHALWSRLKARTSVRGGVEWLKYGEWRLMRLRMALNHPGFEQKIRLAGGAA
ncbi:ParB N-terminal domain-containing protein [Rhodovulum sulfidophilum]|nr:ParB N-terminal domain-containing protein [Rhodovulum sulfidophilum]